MADRQMIHKVKHAEVHHFYDGPVEFVGFADWDGIDNKTVFGRIQEETWSDQTRVYDVWVLPPTSLEPSFTVREDEIGWEATDD